MIKCSYVVTEQSSGTVIDAYMFNAFSTRFFQTALDNLEKILNDTTTLFLLVASDHDGKNRVFKDMKSLQEWFSTLPPFTPEDPPGKPIDWVEGASPAEMALSRYHRTRTRP